MADAAGKTPFLPRASTDDDNEKGAADAPAGCSQAWGAPGLLGDTRQTGQRRCPLTTSTPGPQTQSQSQPAGGQATDIWPNLTSCC